jgi:hypothetical protein
MGETPQIQLCRACRVKLKKTQGYNKNLSLNVIKTNKRIVDNRKKRTEHATFSSTGLQ